MDGDRLPGGQAVASRAVRDQRLQHRTVRETDHHLGRRPQEDGAVDHAREPVGPGEAGLLHLDALRTDHCPACRRVVAGRSLRLEGEVAVPNRAGRRAAREALDVQQVGDAQEVRDELGQRFLVDLLRCPELDDPATVHDGEPGRHLEGFLLVVGDEDEGDADLALQRGQLRPQRVAELRVERAQRLVEEQDRRFEDQGPGQGDALLLSSRHLVGATPGVLGEPDQLQRLLDASLPGPLVEVLAPPQAVGDVLVDVEMREERVALEDRVDRALVGRALRDVDPVEEDLAVGRLLEPAQHAQRGGLSAARRAEEREELTGLDLEVDAVDGGDAVELLAETDDRDRPTTGAMGSGLAAGHASESRQRGAV